MLSKDGRLLGIPLVMAAVNLAATASEVYTAIACPAFLLHLAQRGIHNAGQGRELALPQFVVPDPSPCPVPSGKGPDARGKQLVHYRATFTSTRVARSPPGVSQ
jgi:hypothetical protein